MKFGPHWIQRITSTREHLQATACALLLLTCFLASGCRSTPITGRKQVLFVPEQQEIAMGISAFEETVGNEPTSTNPQYIELVDRVGQRIAAVAGRPDYQWEFRVVAAPEQNAFCLPGGKVAVYEGILPVCDNEAGLAVVMSHEIAHALARHGGERMSHDMAVKGIRHAVEYVTKDREDREREMIAQAYGLGARYGVVLPYSRKHETEADHMGLMLMARAGYDPAEAPRFWERFAASKEGSGPPEFLSTHPSDRRRSDDLRALLVEAGQVYEQNPIKLGLGVPVQDRPSALASTPNAAGPPAAAFYPAFASAPATAPEPPSPSATEAPVETTAVTGWRPRSGSDGTAEKTWKR